MNIVWDAMGNKGASDRFEITLIPEGEGWSTIFFVGRTHLATLPVCESKAEAHQAAEDYLKQLTKTTKRLLNRIGYDYPYYETEGDEEY